jgi:hypothetical protein
MSKEDKLNEVRLEASEILELSEEQVVDLFHRQRKHRRLSRLIRHLDHLSQQGGADASVAAAALKRLGFPLLT